MTTGKIALGFIGAGNMGSAIIFGLQDSLKDYSVSAYDPDVEKLQSLAKKYGIHAADSEVSLARGGDVIIIAVKPDVAGKVLEKIQSAAVKKIVISIAAGVSLKYMEEILGSSAKIIRVMPNTPALIRQGMSVISPNESAGTDSVKIAETIFSKVGKVLVLPEKLMDAVTALSGSGPAFVFTFIQALADGGVKLGIPRDKAVILACQTVLGSASLILQSMENPISMRDKVASPGGTTIEGIHVLETSGFAGIVMDAVEAAAAKARFLNQKARGDR